MVISFYSTCHVPPNSETYLVICKQCAFFGQIGTFLFVWASWEQVPANEMFQIHLCHLTFCAESTFSGFSFLESFFKILHTGGSIFTKSDSASGREEVRDFQGSFNSGSSPADKRMIMHLSLCRLSFQRMNLGVFILFEINTLSSLVV